MDYEKIINSLAKKYNIKIIKKFTGAVGRAFINTNTIKIPKELDTLDKFYVSLHEVGHIIEGVYKTSYETEYYAMQWALNYMKELKIYSKNIEESERRYLTQKLCQAKNRRCKIENIPCKIFKFSRLSPIWYMKSDKIYINGRGWLKDSKISYKKLDTEDKNTPEGWKCYKTIKQVGLPNYFTLD